MGLTPLIAIVGPTGVGKTDVSLRVADVLNGEIISCDAMQVYRETSIVSAKPSADVLAETPHHLVNIASVTEEFDVYRFYQSSRDAVTDIASRNRTPVVVGGSGLYLSVLLDGIFDTQTDASEARAQLENRPQEDLYTELQKVDPEAAFKIHAHDERRTLRALEVFYATGKTISFWQTQREGLWDVYDVHVFVLNRDRSDLYARINARVDAMINDGLCDEVESLKNLPLSRTAARMIGIPEMKAYLDGHMLLEESIEAMKMNSRRFAKRQLTWFRKEDRFQWIDVAADEDTNSVADRIIQAFNQGRVHG